MPSLEGKVAIVTGAAGGIGAAVAARLAVEGARVYCLDLDRTGAHSVAESIGAAGAFVCDTADGTQVREAFDCVFREAGRLDILANVAGVHTSAPFTDITEADFDRVMRVNVTGTFLPSQAAAKLMTAAPGSTGGSIITLASLAAEQVTPTSTAYATSKGAVVSMTRGMAMSLAGDGIRANAIMPGPIDTAMTAESRKDPEYIERMIARIPLGRSGVPDDVAGVVAFLGSDDAAWITGEVIHLDGGISALR